MLDLTQFDVVLVSSSGGKDSEVALHEVCEAAQCAGVLDRVQVIHCDLGRAEWAGTAALVERQAARYGVPVTIMQASQGDLPAAIEKRHEALQRRAESFSWAAGKLLAGDTLEEVMRELPPRYAKRATQWQEREARTLDVGAFEDLAILDRSNPVWPSSVNRYCTSDQKRAVILRRMTAIAQELGLDRPVRIANVTGLRKSESPARGKRLQGRELEHNAQASNGRRTVTDWHPIADWSEAQVWECIGVNGLEYHEAYDLGMPRLSCALCIFARRGALLIAGRHNRELLDHYVGLEERFGAQFTQEHSLTEIRDAIDAGEQPVGKITWEACA